MTGTIPKSTSTDSAESPGRATAVLALLFAAVYGCFAFEVMPVGLLSQMAEGLRTDEGGIGLLVSAYAVVVAVLAIPLSAFAARFEAKRVFIALTLLLALSTVGVAVSASLPFAMGARVLGGAAHAAFFTVVFRIALAIVPADRRGRAATIVTGAVAVATATAVPAAAWFGAIAGWQLPHLVVATGLVVVAVIAIWVVPAGGADGDAMSAKTLLRAAGQAPLLRVGATVALFITAHYAAYTYIEPTLIGLGATTGTLALLLAGYGVAGIVGLLLVARAADRSPRTIIIIAMAVTAVGIGTVMLGDGQVAVLGVAMAAWGIGIGVFPALGQTLSMRAAGNVPSAGPTVVNTSFNVGISVGAVVGATLYGSLGSAGLLVAAAVAALIVAAVAAIPGWLPSDRQLR